MHLRILPLLVFLLFLNGLLYSQDKPPVAGQPEMLGIYEKLDQYIPDDLMFTDENGQLVNFKSLIDKPTILTLVYYTCPGICSPLLDGVAEVITRSEMTLGKEFQVLTVSFNAKETYHLAKSKKKNYVNQVKKQIDTTQWKWFVGDSINIYKLTNSVGFQFKKEGNDFIHAAAIIVLSPEGKITRYLYGTYFLPFDLKMAVSEAAKGKSGPTINKILNFCFSYDAEGKKYVFNITKVSATVILFFAFSLLIYLFTTKGKKRQIKKEY